MTLPTKADASNLPKILLLTLFVLLWIPNIRVLPAEVPSHAFVVVLLGIWFVIRFLFSPSAIDYRLLPGFLLIVCSGVFLAIWSVASAGWSEEPFRVFRITYSMLSGLIAMLAIMQYASSSERLQFVVKGYVIGTLCLAFFLIAIRWIPGLDLIILVVRGATAHDAIELRDRFAGFFKQANQYGIALSTSFAPCLAYMLSQHKHGRLIRLALWSGLGFIVVSIFLSGSKANILLSLLLALAVAGHIAVDEKDFTKVVMRFILIGAVLVAAVAIGAFLLNWLNPRAFDMLSTFLSGDVQGVSSLRTRSFIWEASIDAGLENPLRGTGAGSYILGYSHSHNVLLDYFRGMGFPGLFALLACLAGIAKGALYAFSRARAFKSAPAIFVGLLGGATAAVGYIASNMSSDSFGPSTIMFLFINLGLVFAAANLSIKMQVIRRVPTNNRPSNGSVTKRILRPSVSMNRGV